MTKFYFRVDSSETIGTGHVARCLALAIEAQKNMIQCVFLMQEMHPALQTKISTLGFEVVQLNQSSKSSHHDFIQYLNSVRDRAQLQLLIIDHYGIPSEVERSARSILPVWIIDDLPEREHCCDILLDGNYRKNGQANYQLMEPPPAQFLLGPSFCLLAAPFAEARKKLNIPNKKSDQVVIFFGGTDPLGGNQIFIEQWKQLSPELREKKKWILITTKMQPDYQGIHFQAQNTGLQVQCEPNIPMLFSESAFYIGSGGTVTWERFCLGLTGCVVSVARNQEKISQDLASDDYHDYLGGLSSSTVGEAICRIVAAEFQSPQVQNRIQKCMSLIDGKGTERALIAAKEFLKNCSDRK